MKAVFFVRPPFISIVLLLCPLSLLSGCISKEKPTSETAAKALIGEWQAVKTENTIQGLDGVKKIVFTSAKEAWLIAPNNRAYKSLYWMNPTSRPMNMDILAPSVGIWMTTYQFLDADTIQILPHQQGLQQKRPGGLDSGGVSFRRISSKGELDEAIKVEKDALPSAQAQESEANLYMNTLIFALRDYHDKNRTFTTKLSDLNPGFTNDFLDYRYQVVLWGDKNVLIYVQPLSSGLKSFSALLTTGEGLSSAIATCRSKQPTLVAPTFVKYPDGPYICAADAEDPGPG